MANVDTKEALRLDFICLDPVSDLIRVSVSGSASSVSVDSASEDEGERLAGVGVSCF